MKAYTGILHTAEITASDVKQEDGDIKWNYTEEQAEAIATYMRAWDGIEATFIEDALGGGYSLVGWLPEEDPKVKEAIWLMEQDPVFGNYQGNREKFDEDWGVPDENGKLPEETAWEPSGAIVFEKKYVEITSHIIPLSQTKGGNHDKETTEEDQKG